MGVMLFKSVAFVFFSSERADDANTRQIFLRHRREFAFVFVAFEKARTYFSVEQKGIAYYYRHRDQRNDGQKRIHRKHENHR